MKKTLLKFALAVLIASLALPFKALSDPSDRVSAGKHFVELLSKQDFAGACAQLDTTMSSALPEPKLREIWQTLQEQAGPFQKQLGATMFKLAGYDVVLVTCQFKQSPLDAKVVFDAQGRVAGLFFLPSQGVAETSPLPPYAHTNSYHEIDFTVGQGEWQLPGTLTLPTGQGPWPALVLVQGSGPEDRDETVAANKPFRDLAWGLASQGIAVLRYEKRTKQYADKLKNSSLAHFTVQEETIDDALAAAAQLRTTPGVDPHHVFVLGHSLGGMVAPRIGQADPQIAGLIIMAGCMSRPLEDVIVGQIKYLNSLAGTPSTTDEARLTAIESQAAKVRQLTTADAGSSTILLGATPSYWLDLHEHDSLAILKKLKQPVLLLQGGRDYQVSPDDFHHFETTLAGQPNLTFKVYPKLNHLFITGEGPGTPSEYSQPGHVAEPVVTDIAAWIKSH